jgi:hypothetical protein
MRAGSTRATSRETAPSGGSAESASRQSAAADQQSAADASSPGWQPRLGCCKSAFVCTQPNGAGKAPGAREELGSRGPSPLNSLSTARPKNSIAEELRGGPLPSRVRTREASLARHRSSEIAWCQKRKCYS